jgi:uncharacterized protein YbbK (DUF523 family)
MIIVSACLLGICCRYDGQSKPEARILELIGRKKVIPVCPEQLGGLPTPRSAAYITAGIDGFAVLAGSARVRTIDGQDVTENFKRGAEQVSEIARLYGARRAILKAKSPSCGISGCTGVTAAALILGGLDLEEI